MINKYLRANQKILFNRGCYHISIDFLFSSPLSSSAYPHPHLPPALSLRPAACPSPFPPSGSEKKSSKRRRHAPQPPPLPWQAAVSSWVVRPSCVILKQLLQHCSNKKWDTIVSHSWPLLKFYRIFISLHLVSYLFGLLIYLTSDTCLNNHFSYQLSVVGSEYFNSIV